MWLKSSTRQMTLGGFPLFYLIPLDVQQISRNVVLPTRFNLLLVYKFRMSREMFLIDARGLLHPKAAWTEKTPFHFSHRFLADSMLLFS